MNNYEKALKHLGSLLDNNEGFDKVSNAAYELAYSIEELSSKEKYILRQIGAHAYDICEEIDSLRNEVSTGIYDGMD